MNERYDADAINNAPKEEIIELTEELLYYMGQLADGCFNGSRVSLRRINQREGFEKINSKFGIGSMAIGSKVKKLLRELIHSFTLSDEALRKYCVLVITLLNFLHFLSIFYVFFYEKKNVSKIFYTFWRKNMLTTSFTFFNGF